MTSVESRIYEAYNAWSSRIQDKMYYRFWNKNSTQAEVLGMLENHYCLWYKHWPHQPPKEQGHDWGIPNIPLKSIKAILDKTSFLERQTSNYKFIRDYKPEITKDTN